MTKTRQDKGLSESLHHTRTGTHDDNNDNDGSVNQKTLRQPSETRSVIDNKTSSSVVLLFHNVKDEPRGTHFKSTEKVYQS